MQKHLIIKQLVIKSINNPSQRGIFGLFSRKEQFKKEQGKFGKDRSDSYRTEYEKEIKQRTESKLNWNIKNRWEQRLLDDVLKNQDVRNVRFRDFAKLSTESYGRNLQSFNSVDEIYYFMENMFTEGFTEHHISLALDIFLRDAAQFEDKDLSSPTFQQFIRELGKNLITFQDEKSYVKTARFLDIYCVEDKYLWINLEMFLMKKDKLFSPKSLVQIMGHFASQNEGSRDFYDFFEFQFSSNVFNKLPTHDLISLGYNFYLVHAGTVSFFLNYGELLLERLDDTVTTYDLLRVLQTFSEISQRFFKLFTQLELIFLKRFEQMTVDELTCCSSGFAISGFGTQYLFDLCERGILSHLSEFQGENIKEVCRAFVFSLRGSKELHKILLPRIQQQLSSFTCNELCYMLHAYFKAGYLPKIFATEIETEVVKTLRNIKDIPIEQLSLITSVFCSTRTGSREFHKLLETAVITRLDDLKKKMEILYAIGQKFEESGLCSIDTLKILKKHAFQAEVEKDVYE